MRGGVTSIRLCAVRDTGRAAAAMAGASAASASPNVSSVPDGPLASSAGGGGPHVALSHPGQRTRRVYGRAHPPPSNKQSWDSLEGLLVSVQPKDPASVFEDRPVALGRLIAKLSETAYTAKIFRATKKSHAGALRSGDTAPSLTLGVGTRVTISFEGNPASVGTAVDSGMYMKGTIAKVNGNATYIVLMDNDEVELSVAPERIVARQPRRRLFDNAKLLELVGWLRSCVHDPGDVEAIALMLFSRGWRVDRMYLLEKADVSQFVFVAKLERDRISEKAQWERDHRDVTRALDRERVKDGNWRYAVAKYKGTISCLCGVLVVSYVFTTNLRAYRRQQRGHQLKTAIKTLSKSAQSAQGEGALATTDRAFVVKRGEEEALVHRVLTQMMPSHPRIVAFTGSSGSGKGVLCSNAVRMEGVPFVHVNVRGTEDTLRSVVKALGVNNMEVCGDLLAFVEEAMRGAAVKGSDRLPFLVLKLREDSDLHKVYGELVSLVSDYQACHIILEVPVEALTRSSVSLPRLDFYHIPPFSREQALAYTQHRLDALDLLCFIETAGTNSNDIDELYAALRQRSVDPVTHTSHKLMRAMRRLQAALGPPGSPARATIGQLASMPFAEGLQDDSVADVSVLDQTDLRAFVLYDPVHGEWRFTQQAFHTAARCLLI
ncbi:hypothetical protein JIQ42_08127 [Leishmania sp. Namibia]|uniref:hypothetical protein n=1 Tax=Leishmania sp. Namibia TaxID=2802991 RepID=UPI001B653DB3|nr:hypothetical protein JIQ42_08127 [Leishmania sp. Namibia]